MQDSVQQVLTTVKQESSPRCYKRYINMVRCFGEVLIILIVVFTSYANLQKSALKVQLQPPPVPFFYPNSTVQDFYGGDVASPFMSVMSSDISLVMYYAPWDFDSQQTKKVFEELALKYKYQIYFSAINCWVLNGSCRQIFPKLKSFPVIMGYVGGNNGIQFRGPLQMKYLDSFVQHLIKPLERVESNGDLFRLLAKSTGVVTAYFNFGDVKPRGFYSFYVASLKYLEYDAQKSTKFAIITNPKAAKALGIANLSSSAPYDIRLHLWNETLIFPANATGIDVNRLLQWILYRSHSPIQRIWPNDRKSQIIQHYLSDQNKPSFILFTPETDHSFQYLAVKEIALEYYNCASAPRILNLVEEIRAARDLFENERLTRESQCSIFSNEEPGTCTSQLKNVTEHSINTIKLEVTNNRWLDQHCSEMCYYCPKTNFRGSGCRTNKTLNFYVLDSELYPNFIFKLGYSVKSYNLNPNVAIIIDPQDESYYILNQLPTTKNLKNWITNFTNGELTRHRRSSSPSHSCTGPRLCLETVIADEFQTVLDPGYDTMVYYFKSGCIFCDAGARTFLRLSQMFRITQNVYFNSSMQEIKFVTLNAEENDLPWQFTVEKYPTIVFYPAERKMDSRMFPYDMELNVPNLLNFTLSQLSLRKRVLWFIHFCNEPACLVEALKQIDAQSASIDQHVRTIRYRLSLATSIDAFLMEELRTWLKERYFYKELQYIVIKALSDLKQKTSYDLYPEGVRWSYSRS